MLVVNISPSGLENLSSNRIHLNLDHSASTRLQFRYYIFQQMKDRNCRPLKIPQECVERIKKAIEPYEFMRETHRTIWEIIVKV